MAVTDFFILLGKHYYRKGNRIIFSNRMTLNKFAMSMWEKLGYKDIDPSVISRFIKGERLLNIKQFKVFCRILNIKETDEKELVSKLNQEILSRICNGENLEYLKNDFFSEQIWNNIEIIRQARSYDNPNLAYKIVLVSEEQLFRHLAQKNKISFLKTHLLLLGTLLIQKKILLLEAFQFDSVLSQLNDIIQKFIHVAKVTNEKEYFGHADALKGRIDYQNNNYRSALSYDISALGYIEDPEEKSALLGRIGIEYAILNRTKEAKNIQRRISDESDRLSDREDLLCINNKYNSQISTLLLQEENARKYSAQAWNIFNSKLSTTGKYRYIRNIQLDYNEYLIKSTFEGKSNHELCSAVKKSKNISAMFGYQSYLDSGNAAKNFLKV